MAMTVTPRVYHDNFELLPDHPAYDDALRKREKRAQRKQGVQAKLLRKAEADQERLLNLALSWRKSGDYDRCEESLEEAVAKGLVIPTAAAAAAMCELAVLHCQRREFARADHFLSLLGFGLRLSPDVLAYHTRAALERPLAPPSSVAKLATAFDGVLDKPLLAELRHAFRPDSAFFEQHEYPTPAFFSYNYNFGGRRGGAGASADREPEPVHLLGRLHTALAPLVAEHFPAVAENATSLEWWAHARDSDAGHQLHFDLDERRLHASGTVHSPLLSCVLYLLVGGGTPNPTLVTSQKHGGGGGDEEGEEDEEEDVAWLCEPVVNRLLAFDGSLLHGVVPPAPPASGAPLPSAVLDQKRVTLMLGWWGPHVSKSRAPVLGESRRMVALALGPNMPMPSPGLGAPPGSDWFDKEFVAPAPTPAPAPLVKAAKGAKGRKRPREQPEAYVPRQELGKNVVAGRLEYVGPCWTRVRRGPEAARESLEEAKADFSFVAGWFANSHDDIRASLLPSRGFQHGDVDVDGGGGGGGGGGSGGGGGGGGGGQDEADGGEFMSIEDAIRMASQGGPQSLSHDKGPTGMYQ